MQSSFFLHFVYPNTPEKDSSCIEIMKMNRASKLLKLATQKFYQIVK